MPICRSLLLKHGRMPISRWVELFQKGLYPWGGKHFFLVNVDWRHGPVCPPFDDINGPCTLSEDGTLVFDPIHPKKEVPEAAFVDGNRKITMELLRTWSDQPYSEYVDAFASDMKLTYELNNWPFRGLEKVDAWGGPKEYLGNCTVE